MKKKYIILLFFSFLATITFAQDYTWAWINQLGSNKEVKVNQLLTAEDAVYVTGRFKQDLIFEDNLILSAPNSNSEYFIIKFEKNGTFQWAKIMKFGQSKIKLTTDQAGDIIVAGMIFSSQLIDGVLFNIENGNLFYLKYSPDWELLSTTRITLGTLQSLVAGYEDLLEIMIDNSGNKIIIFTGKVQPNRTFPYDGFRNVFILKYNVDNQYEWIKNISSDFNTPELQFEIDSKDHLVFGGNFRRTFSFEQDTLPSTSNDSQIIVAKITSTGNLKWMKNFGNDESETVVDIELDEEDNIYITGLIEQGEVKFDHIIVNAISRDLFFAKINSFGGVEVVKVESSTYSGLSPKNLTLTEGSVIINGTYFGSIEYPEGSGNFLPYQAGDELYLAIYSKAGIFKDLISITGNCSKLISDIKLLGNQLLFTGLYSCRVYMGDSYIEETIDLPTSGLNNFYLTSIDLDQYIGYAENTGTNLLVYPNPTNGSFTVDLRGLGLPDDSVASIEITDINGKRIFYEEFSTQVFSINNLSPAIGIYPVIIRTQDKVFTEKLLFLDL